MDKTTIGGYVAAIGAAFVAGASALPITGYDSVRTIFVVGGAMATAAGVILLGTYSSDSTKTVTLDQVQEAGKRNGPHAPLTASSFIDPGPPPEKHEAPPSSKI